ncbi:phosphoadenylyl-sulfate reductase [Brevibacillus ruminantium]|uniref:Adenosine 5'-phosphosulfate reductase n=1 Tax=Brevibacillus ruminantium TaxID=2950604 RepID=A0ABY4WB83_9BACL|nr:phosphoadenylyl-sulfate reductase [Brevibacillus ruminantium]USG64297.1 phosphoadenylyl-sulfate reductase [Brevibacillus ruminantium]
MTYHGRFSREELNLTAYRLENKQPQDVIAWGVEQFGTDIILASSFGAEDVVLIDMLHQLAPQTPIFYLDTGKHFPETLETKDRLEERYGMSFIQVLPKLSLEEQEAAYGEKLWEREPNLCCQLRKVEPLTEILSKYSAWITGIRREQAPTRANAKKVEWDEKFQLVKLNPLADWTREQVWSYIRTNDVIYNPLHDRHYPSIGCSVCTRPVAPGEDPRAGRWSGFDKTECGLHK